MPLRLNVNVIRRPTSWLHRGNNLPDVLCDRYATSVRLPQNPSNATLRFAGQEHVTQSTIVDGAAMGPQLWSLASTLLMVG
jgi:hypothetical protein